VGHQFSLVLNREITDDESAILQGAGCAEATFATDSLPTNADVTVTKMDFDDTTSPSLAEAIEAALEAVKQVPDLSVPGLTVPAQPAQPAQDDAGAEVLEGVVVEAATPPNGDKPAAKKPAAKRTSAKKPSAKKASNGSE